MPTHIRKSNNNSGPIFSVESNLHRSASLQDQCFMWRNDPVTNSKR